MKKIICILIVTAALLNSCATRYESNSYFALDTFITLNVPEKNGVDVYSVIKYYESLLSKTDSDSEIYKINESFEYEASDEVTALLKYALEISEKTYGTFDITCGNLMSLWNFKKESPRPPCEEDVKKALFYTGYKNVAFDENKVKKEENIKLDLGGIAKGYIAEKCVEYLHENKVTSGFLNLGGNIAIVGEKENGEGWSVGIKDPLNTSSTVGNIILSDGYISVSGDYERYFEYEGKKYHHIIDTKTGYPADTDIISTAVISEDGTLADALSTALFVMGVERSLEFYKEKIYDFEAVLITKKGEIYITDGIKDRFTLTSGDYILKTGDEK